MAEFLEISGSTCNVTDNNGRERLEIEIRTKSNKVWKTMCSNKIIEIHTYGRERSDDGQSHELVRGTFINAAVIPDRQFNKLVMESASLYMSLYLPFPTTFVDILHTHRSILDREIVDHIYQTMSGLINTLPPTTKDNWEYVMFSLPNEDEFNGGSSFDDDFVSHLDE